LAWGELAPALRATSIRTRSFDADLGFTLDGSLKDVQLILEAAAEVHVQLHASLIHDECIVAQAYGMG
jgi:hypothetical protein